MVEDKRPLKCNGKASIWLQYFLDGIQLPFKYENIEFFGFKREFFGLKEFLGLLVHYKRKTEATRQAARLRHTNGLLTVGKG